MSSEVLIQCGVCKSNLSVDSQAVSTHVSCPHCHQRVLVPLPEIKFSCEICQTPYECLQALGGEIFDCVVCNDEFIVPTVGQELPLRNGRVTTTGARNILRFKGPDPHQTAAAPAEPMPGATCQPPRRPSRIVFPSVSAFSILKYGAGIVLLILMINLVPSFLSTSPPSPPLSPSSPSAPSTPSTPSPPLSPPVVPTNTVPTNTVDLTPWDGATDALKALQANGESSDALDRVDGFITSIGDTNLMVKGWMMRIWALSKLSQEGTRGGGVGGLEFIRREFPDTPLAEKTSLADYVDKCKGCNGEKKISSRCPACNGFERCPGCGGTGYIEEKIASAPNQKTRTPRPEPKSRLKTKRLGKEAPAVAPPPSETTRRLTCENCKGTGRCAKCRGAGSISTPCTTCNAKGTEFSKDNVRAECLLAIARCLELIAKQKQDRVPPAGGGQSDLAVRFRAACARAQVVN